jgi:D-glycero-D-manno-heptose 1,7-bisphosphate phosphatase
MTLSKAVFLDRDGVLNADTDYPYLPQHITWIPGAFDAVRLANIAGYKVFVITNQSGVARGLYTERHVQDLHKWMAAQFRQHNARIDDFAYCPHHPTEGQGAYKEECDCRKPKPGMIKELMARHNIGPVHSFMIGDKESDVQAAEAAGIQGHLFNGENLADMVKALLKT